MVGEWDGGWREKLRRAYITVIVIAMDNAPESIRGELTKWFLELKPGVFVGNVNARIRDLLWNRVCTSPEAEGAILVYPDKNEQGFSFRLSGTPKRTIVDLDGIQLVKTAFF